MSLRNNTNITIKLGENSIHPRDVHQITVAELRRYTINLKGAPVQVEEANGNYQFTWRGASRPRTFTGQQPAYDLLREAETLTGLYDQHSEKFTF